MWRAIPVVEGSVATTCVGTCAGLKPESETQVGFKYFFVTFSASKQLKNCVCKYANECNTRKYFEFYLMTIYKKLSPIRISFYFNNLNHTFFCYA